MKIDLVTKTIHTRSSEISSALWCPRQSVLQLKQLLEVGEVEEETSPALRLGTEFHKWIENIFVPGTVEEGEEMCSEVHNLLHNPKCIFERLDLYRPAISLNCEQISKMELVSFTIMNYEDLKETFIGKPEETDPVELAKFFVQHINSSSALFEARVCKSNCKRVWVRSVERGSHTSDMRIVNANWLNKDKMFPESETCNDTSLADAICPEMFGNKLTRFEERFEYNLYERGWKIKVTGQVDSATEDGSVICDWKTIRSTPQAPISFMHLNYYFQQGIYRILDLRSKQQPFKPATIILAFVVKNKTPKFYPVALELSKSQYARIDQHINSYVTSLVDFLEKGVIPSANYSDKCRWCKFDKNCLTIDPVLPREVPLNYLFI